MKAHLALLSAVVALILAHGASGAVWAQQFPSLAEVARKEEARRKTIKTESRKFTNEDLRRAPGSSSVAAPPPAPAATPAPAAGEPAAGDEEDPEEPPRDQEYWRSRITAARTELARTQLFLEGLQTRANSLAADFVNRDDPAQRAVIERNRQETLREIDRLTQEVVNLEKSIADIQEEARRAGVPPGWLR